MEKENYSDIIIEAMRLADKHLEKNIVRPYANQDLSELWLSTFKSYAKAALELVKPVEKSN